MALLLRAILEQNRKYRKSENVGKYHASLKDAGIVDSQQHGVPMDTKLNVCTNGRESKRAFSPTRRHFVSHDLGSLEFP